MGSMDPYTEADSQTGSGSKTGKTPTKIEKISLFEVLDVVFLGLKASPVACTFFMEA
jgi:hypothetical protein